MRYMTTCAAALMLAGQAQAFDGWHLEKAVTLPSKTASFDYLTLDQPGHRLFIGHRKEGLQVYDIGSGKITAVIAGTAEASSNGAVLLPEFDLGLSSNENGTLVPFRLSTLQVGETVRLADELDTSHYDPVTKRVFVNLAADKDGAEIAVLQAPALTKIGSIKLATRKPEHAVFDGQGSMYMASRDLDRVYRIDTKAMTVTAEWPTTGCAQANSTAIDTANKRLFVACRGSDTVKPSLVVMNTDTGTVGYKAEIGGGNDGLVFDPKTKRLFAANGLTAMLNVFEQVDADTYRPLEALGTRAMAKVLAYDETDKKLYSMTAETSADFGKKINTAVGPFYPNTFLPDTFTILTYSR